MNKVFTDNGWKDYVYWQTEDKKTAKKINILIDDISRNGNEGIGKPEALSGNLVGFWSRRINVKDRLIYKLDKENMYILACRYHYNDNIEIIEEKHQRKESITQGCDFSVNRFE